MRNIVMMLAINYKRGTWFLCSLLTLITANSQEFDAGIQQTRCDLSEDSFYNPCPSLFDAVCNGYHCICPPEFKENKDLELCTKLEDNDDFYVEYGNYEPSRIIFAKQTQSDFPVEEADDDVSLISNDTLIVEIGKNSSDLNTNSTDSIEPVKKGGVEDLIIEIIGEVLLFFLVAYVFYKCCCNVDRRAKCISFWFGKNNNQVVTSTTTYAIQGQPQGYQVPPDQIQLNPSAPPAAYPPTNNPPQYPLTQTQPYPPPQQPFPQQPIPYPPQTFPPQHAYSQSSHPQSTFSHPYPHQQLP